MCDGEVGFGRRFSLLTRAMKTPVVRSFRTTDTFYPSFLGPCSTNPNARNVKNAMAIGRAAVQSWRETKCSYGTDFRDRSAARALALIIATRLARPSLSSTHTHKLKHVWTW